MKNFSTFGFKYKPIFEYLNNLTSITDKLNYIEYINKEINKNLNYLNTDFAIMRIFQDWGVNPYIEETREQQHILHLNKKRTPEEIDELKLDIERNSCDLLKTTLKEEISTADTYNEYIEVHQKLMRRLEEIRTDLNFEKEYLLKVTKSYDERNSITNTIAKTEPSLESQNEITDEKDKIPKIIIKSSLSDVTRIIQAMIDSGIISSKTEIKQLARLFHDPNFENKFTATKSRIKNTNSRSNSKELVDFIKELLPALKNPQLEEIVEDIEDLQKKIV